MLERVKDKRTGIVHFVCPANAGFTLCCETRDIPDLFGLCTGRSPNVEKTTERVTCADCTKVVCAIRNEPYNTLDASVEDSVMEDGMYAAVEPPTEHQPKGE